MPPVIAQSTPPAPGDIASVPSSVPVESGAKKMDLSFEALFAEPLQKMATDTLDSIIGALPSFISGVMILIIGWIVAVILSKVIGGTLEKIGFDNLLEKVGVARLLQRLGITGSVTQILAKAIFWVVILFIIRSASEALGLADISALIEQIFAFLPKAITAAIILLVGFMVADIIQNAVFTKLDALGIRYANTLAGLIFGFIVILVLTVALPQLGVETRLLNATVSILVGGIALAMAICLGLGMKTLAQNIVAGVYARDIYKTGTVIHRDGKEMTLSGIGPVTTKCVEEDGTFHVFPNSELILEKTSGRSISRD